MKVTWGDGSKVEIKIEPQPYVDYIEDVSVGYAKGGLISSNLGGEQPKWLQDLSYSTQQWTQEIHANPPFTYTGSSFTDIPMPEPRPLPDGICGNCRRDWHEAPLTRTVARMWDDITFDEDYDPDADDSPLVCPGSECCGPVADYRSRHSNGAYTVTSWTAAYKSNWTFTVPSFNFQPMV